jgi:hypothetical protein
MANPRSNKREVERARLEKAAAKRERRQARAHGDVTPTTEMTDTGEAQSEVLTALARLHEDFERGLLSFADFEAEKTDLMGRLRVD